MPAGVDFTCKNEECECFNTKVTILSSWPIADIDDVIGSIKIEEYKVEFEKAKQNGKKYACIKFPNEDEVKMVGWKVQSWCSKCPRIGEDEILLSHPDETFEEAMERYDLPEKCPVCEGDLKSFDELIEEGMLCPFCNEEMEMERWFAKEVSIEYAGGR
jgi:thiol-disulfide isomerase/thioredoxin